MAYPARPSLLFSTRLQRDVAAMQLARKLSPSPAKLGLIPPCARANLRQCYTRRAACQPDKAIVRSIFTSTMLSPTSSVILRISVVFPDPRAPFTKIESCRVLFNAALDKQDDRRPRKRLTATVLNGAGEDSTISQISTPQVWPTYRVRARLALLAEQARSPARCLSTPSP